MRKKNHYVDNKKLYEKLSTFIYDRRAALAAKTETPRIPEYVGRVIRDIANNYATKPSFSGYSYVDEMKGDAIENCVMYIHNFDPDKSKNAFGYISLIIHNAFLRRIQKEHKESYTRHKLMVSGNHINQLTYGGTHSSEEVDSLTLGNDTSHNIIKNFEDKIEKKKRDKKEKERLKNV